MESKPWPARERFFWMEVARGVVVRLACRGGLNELGVCAFIDMLGFLNTLEYGCSLEAVGKPTAVTCHGEAQDINI